MAGLRIEFPGGAEAQGIGASFGSQHISLTELRKTMPFPGSFVAADRLNRGAAAECGDGERRRFQRTILRVSIGAISTSAICDPPPVPWRGVASEIAAPVRLACMWPKALELRVWGS
jgi:hypothetical protein